MKNCPVCGKEIPVGNKFCSLACFKLFQDENKIPEIENNLRFGGDVL